MPRLKKLEDNLFIIESDFKDKAALSSYEIGDGVAYDFDASRLNIHSTWDVSQFFRFFIVLEWIKQWDAASHKEISILDLGCSWSQLYRLWIAHGHYFNHPRTDYVGVDLDRGRIMQGRKTMRVRKRDTATHILADVTKPHEWGVFDVVASLETLEHVPREAGIAMIKNAWNSVRPGGCMILSSPNPQKDQGQEAQWGDKHAYEWQWEEVRPVIEGAVKGGEITRTCGVLPVRSFKKQASRDEKLVLKSVRDHLPYALASNLVAVGSDIRNCKQWMVRVDKEL